MKSNPTPRVTGCLALGRNVVMAAAVLASAVLAAAAADMNPSGTVSDVTGGAVVDHTAKAFGRVIFARIDKAHDVTVRWVDTKGRLCGTMAAKVAPPAGSLAYSFDTATAVGYNHRIEVLVDGKLGPAGRKFTVQYPYKPWIDYHAHVWAHYEAAHADLIRAAGFDGTIGPSANVTDADLLFYPDNIAYETFAYYHKRRLEHQAIRDAWARDPGSRTLHHRRPSLTDEGTWEKFRDRMLSATERCKPYRPLFYNMADEIGIADQSAVSDLDWEYSSRTAWREWLQRKYVTVAALNRQWGTDHRSWAAVRAFFPSTHHMYDQLWERHLLPRAFGTVAKYNAGLGCKYDSFAAVVAGYRAVRGDDAGMGLAGLKKRFGSAEGLAGRLGGGFAGIEDAAAYLAKFEQWARRQNAADTRGWNLSWWCDWRDYMDDYMADALGRARDIARTGDPGGCFGITGTHHPGVFNGHNYARLIRNVDMIIPYNIGQSFELIRGLEPGYLYMHPTWATGKKLRRDLWYHFLHGCHGVLFWDNHEAKNKVIDRKTRTLTARGKAGAPVLKEVRAGLDRLLLQSRREANGIAIYHSQASARVNWWHQFINLGRQWIRRQSWQEYREDERSVLRTSWIKLIEDNHLQYLFVTPQQAAEGRLAGAGVKVLILPEVWAMGDEEAERIAAFVRAGGTVIADQYTGLYDAHGRRRAMGALDGLFGIDQSAVPGDARTDASRREQKARPLGEVAKVIPALKGAASWDSLTTRGPETRGVRCVAADAKVMVGDRGDAALIVRGVGQGKAVFLNLDVSRYGRVRMAKLDQAERLLSVVRFALPAAVRPTARIINAKTGRRLPGSEVGVWTAGPKRKLLAVWRNYNLRKEGIGGEAFADNALFEREGEILVKLDRKYHVLNQRTGEALGRVDEVRATLSPWEPVILTLQDVRFGKTRVAVPAAAKRGDVLTLTVTPAADLAGDLQVFTVKAVNPAGRELWYYGGDLSTRGRPVTHTVPLALNEWTGQWTFTVRDAATGTVAKHTVEVGE